MTQYFILIFVSSLWCCGLNTITQEGTIGYPFRKAVVKIFPEWIAKPIINCLPCMASVHTGIVFLFLHFVFGFQLGVFIYIFAAISTAFVNVVMWSLFGAYKFLVSLGEE